MSYVTVEVEIDHGKVVSRDAEQLPEKGRGLLTILPSNGAHDPAVTPAREAVKLPLIQGDGRRIINPRTEELDASLWG
jgi:hypothetical protein